MVRRHGSFPGGDDVEVIEERQQRVFRVERTSGFLQGAMLCQRVQRRHQWVPLFAALALPDLVLSTFLVIPEIA